MPVSFAKDTNRSANQQQKEKVCQFPGCKEVFVGRGKTKYCEEHRKQEYKKILYKPKKPQSVDENNQKIKHKFLESQNIIKTCSLEGCGNTYELRIIPNQFIYPKYCEEHRNEWKRNFFIQQRHGN